MTTRRFYVVPYTSLSVEQPLRVLGHRLALGNALNTMNKFPVHSSLKRLITKVVDHFLCNLYRTDQCSLWFSGNSKASWWSFDGPIQMIDNPIGNLWCPDHREAQRAENFVRFNPPIEKHHSTYFAVFFFRGRAMTSGVLIEILPLPDWRSRRNLSNLVSISLHLLLLCAVKDEAFLK